MVESDSPIKFLQHMAGRLSALAWPSTKRCVNKDVADEVCLQTLEERVLYSAAPLPVEFMSQVEAIDFAPADAEGAFAEAAITNFTIGDGVFLESSPVDDVLLDGEVLADHFSAHSDEDVAMGPAATEDEGSQVSLRRELVVVDLGVPNYQQLVDDLFIQRPTDRAFDVIYLATDRSGIESLARQLADRSADGTTYDAMHIVSHGSQNEVSLGSDRLGQHNVDQFSQSIAGWSAALDVDADLFIYGCEVASDEKGQEFIQSLAELTGADVAASDDITGHASLGGDWEFEYVVGVIETQLAFSQSVQQNWEEALIDYQLARESGGQVVSIGVDGAGRSTLVAAGNETGSKDGFDVLMAVVDQFGNETSDIVVNETLVGDQLYASVAVAENGMKAVTWTSISTVGERAVFAKFYDGSNSVVRGEFRVDIPTAGVEADDSSIAIDAAGNVVIVWESVNGSGDSEVLGRRFAVDGTAAGDVFNISGTGFDELNESANAFVAMNDAGQFVVAWDTLDGSGSDDSIVYARTYNADGSSGSGISVVESQDSRQFTQASADIDSAGNFVIVYTEAPSNGDGGDKAIEISARGYSFDGTLVANYSDDFVEEENGDQYAASVAILDNGNVLIAWEGEGKDQDNEDDNQEVYFATVDFDSGNVLTTQESLSSLSTPQRLINRYAPSVTVADNTSFAWAWRTQGVTTDLLTVENLPSPNNNASPVVADVVFTPLEDTSQAIQLSDFAFSDSDGGTFTQVQIAKLPAEGRVLFNGTPVVSGQVILASELSSGTLIFEPEPNVAGEDSLLFFAHDGTDYAETFTTFTFDVQPVVDGAEVAWGDSFSSTTGSVPVNETTLGSQDRPKISALTDGGYVVVWEGADQDLSVDSDGNGDFDDGQTIYLQRYDSSNDKVGGEITIGANLLGDQTRPSVVGLADGGFIVAATVSAGAGQEDIYAQRFDSNGNVLNAEGSIDGSGSATIVIAEHVQFSQDYTSLTALQDGGFIASWSTLDQTLEAEPGFAAVARIFDALGNAGSEFLLNEADAASDASGQFNTEIAELSNGSIVATWFETETQQTRYRVFDQTGVPLTGEQAASSFGNQLEGPGQVAAVGDNGFVIIWRQGGSGTDSDIVGRQFNLDGVPVNGAEVVLNSADASFNVLPELVSLADGGFVAVWDAVNVGTDSRGIAGLRFDANFNQLGDTFVVNSTQYGVQARPTAALLTSGELVVAFTSADGDNSGATYGNGIFVDRLIPSSVVNEDTNVSLGIVLSAIDNDGSESVEQVQLTGLPAGSQLSDGTMTVDITSTSQVVDLSGGGLSIADLSVRPPANFYGDIQVELSFVATDTEGSDVVTSPRQSRALLIRVDPLNDVAVYEPIAQAVSENGTRVIDLDEFFSPSNDPDNAGANPTVVPVTGYSLSPSRPPATNAGFLEWESSVGTSDTISLEAAHVSFINNPTTDYSGIDAAFDFDGSGGGEVSVDGTRSVEVWFRPDNVMGQQALLEFGDASAGWGLYLNAGQVELHFRSPAAPGDVLPHVLVGGTISSTEFNQVVVAFATDGGLAGDSGELDVALYVNGRQVDLMTDVQTTGDPSFLTGAFTGSLGTTSGGFVHASETSFAGFDGSIARLNLFDEALTASETQHRFFDVAHGPHIVQVDGQQVEPGDATTLGSGATVTFNNDGTLTYDPNGQFEDLVQYNVSNSDSFRRDDFEISVSDGQGDVQDLTVELTVQGENDAPTLTITDPASAPTINSPVGTLVATANGMDVDQNVAAGLTYSLTGAVSGAFAIDSATGEITINDVGVYQNPPDGFPHVVEVTLTDPAGASATSSRAVTIVNEISGTIFEDVVGDGSVLGDRGVDGVTVSLYRDNGDGVHGAGDAFIVSATTSGGGNYLFRGPAISNADYYVVVNSRDITPSNGFNGGLNVDDVWAEQTYGSAGALYLNAFGVETVSTGGTLFGGYSGVRSDDASSLTTAEHITKVTVDTVTDGVADFGFSFNVVTNTLGGDAQDDDTASANRTVQGSLRQFIDNANAIDNSDVADADNAMRFVARNSANSADATWWSVVVSEALPSIQDSNTTINGTVYSAADGVTVLNTRSLRSGTAISVGANDSHTMAGFDQPEFEIVADPLLSGSDEVLWGLVVEASSEQPTLRNVTISNVSIHGFGAMGERGADILITGSGLDGSSAYLVENVTVESSFIGLAPDGAAEAPEFPSHGVQIQRANGGIVRDNLIGFHGLNGVHFTPSAAGDGSSLATGWQILHNEISNNGSLDPQFGGVGLGNASMAEIRHNLIRDNSGFGIDTYFSPGGFTISENTISGNGTGGLEKGGIRVFGDGSVVSENRVIDNAGIGIGIVGTSELGAFFRSAAIGNELTRNEFGGNLGIDIDLYSSLTNGQSFDELDANGTSILNASEIAMTGLTLADHDTNGSGFISRSEYDAAQAQFVGEGDGASPVDGIDVNSGNNGLDRAGLVNAVAYADRVEVELQLASGVDRVELYQVTTDSPERVSYIDTVLVADMTFNASTDSYLATFATSPMALGNLTALAFSGADTSEFSNRLTVNSAPAAAAITLATEEDTPFGFDASIFDAVFVDTDGSDSLQTIQIRKTGAAGQLSFMGAAVGENTFVEIERADIRQLEFEPGTDEFGANYSTLEFLVSDGQTFSDDAYEITVNVDAVNDLPGAESNTILTTEDTDRALAQADFGFSDVEDQSDVSKGAIDLLGVTGGTLRLNGVDVLLPAVVTRADLDSLVFVPAENNDTIGTVRFEVFDDEGQTDGVAYTLTVAIESINDAPNTTDDVVNIVEDTSVNLTAQFAELLANDSDVEGDTLGVVPGSFSSPSNGTLTIDGVSGDLIYTPDSDSAHTESLSYFVSDGNDATNSTLAIVVGSENDAPALAAPGMVDVTENSTFVTTPVGTDIEDGSVGWIIVGGEDQNAFSNSGGDLVFVESPDFENATDATGNNVYQVRIAAVDRDGLQSDSQLIDVHVTNLNEVPERVAARRTVVINGEDGSLAGEGNLNDWVTDPDAGDTMSFSIAQQPRHGVVTVEADGRFVYNITAVVPPPSDSFQFVATDSIGLVSEIVTVDFTVINVAVVPTPDSQGDAEESEDADEEVQDAAELAVLAVGGDEDDEEDIVVPGAAVAVRSSVNGLGTTGGAIGSNGFNDAETDGFGAYFESLQTSRTYASRESSSAADIAVQFAIDRRTVRGARAIEFDLNVLASVFLDELDASKQQYVFNRFEVGTPEIAASAATLLTMSYLVWNMASGLLLSTFMSSLPAWSSFDVLPVIAGSEVGQDDGESIEQMVDA